jgi:ubiquinone/menaquinone biosynthesis C-methylase UbiE
MLARVLEPEVMDTAEEADDYDTMDHGAVNAKFCEDLLAEGAVGPAVLDVGTGTALIPIELCSRVPDVRVVAVDLAEHMLSVAARNVARAKVQDRVMLERADAKKLPYPKGSFQTVVSNSIIHHIPEPGDALAEIRRVTAPGGRVFIRDLNRPASDEAVDRLVSIYEGKPPADPARHRSWAHQRDLLRASLKAALTIDEIEELARSAGMSGALVRMTSDRHWTLAFQRS